MNFKEARRLSKLFPERFFLYAKIIKREYEDKKILLWELKELKDTSLKATSIAGNIKEYAPMGDNFVPLGKRQPCFWVKLGEKDKVNFIP